MLNINIPFVYYPYGGMTCRVDRQLAEEWMAREGLTETTHQFNEAMECVMVNAEGRLKIQKIPVTVKSMKQAAEEVIKEEIMLTGGCV